MGNKGDGYAHDDLQDGCSMHFDDDDLLIDLDHQDDPHADQVHDDDLLVDHNDDDPHADQVHDDAFVVDAAMKLLEPGGVSSLSLWAPMLVMLGACLLCMLMIRMMMMGMIMIMKMLIMKIMMLTVIWLMTSPRGFLFLYSLLFIFC